jgi:hypothetical protein
MQVRDMCREEKDPSRLIAYMKDGQDCVFRGIVSADFRGT